MHAIALAARQCADFLLLIGALEVEGRAIRPRIDFALSELELIEAAGNFFPNRLFAVERVARLIDIAKMDGFTDLDRAAILLVLVCDHTEQSGLAGAVRPDDPDDTAGRQFESQIVNQQIVAEALSQVFEVDDVLA